MKCLDKICETLIQQGLDWIHSRNSGARTGRGCVIHLVQCLYIVPWTRGKCSDLHGQFVGASHMHQTCWSFGGRMDICTAWKDFAQLIPWARHSFEGTPISSVDHNACGSHVGWIMIYLLINFSIGITWHYLWFLWTETAKIMFLPECVYYISFIGVESDNARALSQSVRFGCS